MCERSRKCITLLRTLMVLHFNKHNDIMALKFQKKRSKLTFIYDPPYEKLVAMSCALSEDLGQHQIWSECSLWKCPAYPSIAGCK